jgi:hypothetical protein
MSEFVFDDGAPRLFEYIDRNETELSYLTMPEAPGVIIAGEGMLRAAGHQPGLRRPAGWRYHAQGSFSMFSPSFTKRTPDGYARLFVLELGKYWVIARHLHSGYGYRQGEWLTFPIGPAPIWAETSEAAMRLAEYCHPIPRPPIPGYWTKVGLNFQETKKVRKFRDLTSRLLLELLH